MESTTHVRPRVLEQGLGGLVQRILRRIAATAALALVISTGISVARIGPASADGGRSGAVFTLSNDQTGNSVVAFDRAADGTLTPAGTFATGGAGTGAGLGSQGALILGDHGSALFAVNAGSNEITSFAVRENGLTWLQTVSSGGTRPISLTEHDGVLYVLNAGGTGNITGFNVSKSGLLAPLSGSTRALSTGAAGPAQVEFSPDGRQLVVTEKATNSIDTYTVGEDGIASGPEVHASAGATPFGFAFGKHGQLIVSEAFGGAAAASAASSYDLSRQGDLKTITPSAATGQTAACWIVVTKNGRYAYAANTGSGSISGYSIAKDGALSLLNADGRTGVTGAGSKPIDLALSTDSKFLYSLNEGSHSIVAFAVGADGSLAPIAGALTLPAAVVGLAAR